MNLSKEQKTEYLKIAMCLALAAVLLFLIEPGLTDSPYNEF